MANRLAVAINAREDAWYCSSWYIAVVKLSLGRLKPGLSLRPCVVGIRDQRKVDGCMAIIALLLGTLPPTSPLSLVSGVLLESPICTRKRETASSANPGGGGVEDMHT